ncbi:MAG TPA: kelch repeat-containing protein [Thermoplasmata archaeon]|nr:kelch repeat-containing protein [Thermoplasmata archaeon]
MGGPKGRQATGEETGSPRVRRSPGRVGVRSQWAVALIAVLVALPLPFFILHAASPGTLVPRGGPGPLSADLQTVGPSLFNGSLSANVSDVSMAYDAQSGTVVAVAENLTSAGTFFAPLETWTFESGRWTELAPSSSPPARLGASLVFDPQVGGLVLFGGLGPLGFLSDTWSYTGGTWTNITASSGAAPPGRASGSFVWDPEDSEGVLYGGIGQNGSDWSIGATGMTPTWLFGASGWSEVKQATATVPGPLGAIAYDTRDGYVLDFGGQKGGSSGTAVATTFDFHQGVWSNLTSTVSGAPPARWAGSAVYDPNTSSVLLFGGLDSLSYRNDTWSYASGHWSEISTASVAPSRRAAAPFVDDPSTSSLVLFGGLGVNGPQGDTWTFGASGWVLQGPVLAALGGVLPGSTLVADLGAKMTIGVMGAFAAGVTTYTYSGLPPGCVAFDAASLTCAANESGRYVLSGIVSSSVGESTLPRVSILVNSPPMFASVVLSSTATETGVPVTIRASVQGGTGAYVYQYLGLPQGCQSADVPVLTCDPTVIGSYQVGVAAMDSVGAEVLQTEPLVVGPHPYVESVSASRATVDVGLSTELSVVAGGGVGPLSFSYSGLPSGCLSSNTTGLACAPSGNGSFSVHVLASDAFGFSANGVVLVAVHPRLSAPSLSANTSSVYLGDPVSLTVPTSGGTAPYRYGYAGLPTGCATENASAFSCAPRATGRFTISVTVTDALGESLTVNTTMTVSVRNQPIGPGPVSGGGPNTSLWAALVAAALAVVASGAVALGLVVRRNRRFAREGHELVAGLLEEAPRLGAQYGRFDDPPRQR